MLAHDDQFALVIADPPWVPSSDIGQFPEDPEIAIDGGDDGLDLARACIRVIGGHLMVGGAAVLQLGNLDQADALTDLAKSCGLVFAHPRTFDARRARPARPRLSHRVKEIELDDVRLTRADLGRRRVRSPCCCTGSRTRRTPGGTSAPPWRTTASGWWRRSPAATRPRTCPADGRTDVGALMADAVGIHAALGGGDDAVLVGHDWGALTAGALAAHRDSPYARVVTMAVPPIPAMRRASVRHLPGQARRSWYIGVQPAAAPPGALPGPAGAQALARLVARVRRRRGRRRTCSTALATPEHRRAAIGYYRSAAPVRGASPLATAAGRVR